ncbi:MAG TPA: hypothetical protein VGQ08_00565 [Nitrospiraceae bacterium]|nr:hypothetical protein [Nitrospiraceae bacterium]
MAFNLGTAAYTDSRFPIAVTDLRRGEQESSSPSTNELQAEASRATTPGKVVNGAFGLKRGKRYLPGNEAIRATSATALSIRKALGTDFNFVIAVWHPFDHNAVLISHVLETVASSRDMLSHVGR